PPLLLSELDEPLAGGLEFPSEADSVDRGRHLWCQVGDQPKVASSQLLTRARSKSEIADGDVAMDERHGKHLGAANGPPLRRYRRRAAIRADRDGNVVQRQRVADRLHGRG